MAQLYDEIDANGNLTLQGVKLVPGMQLPEGSTWVPHTVPLSTLRELKKQEIEQTRNTVQYGNVSYLSTSWQADPKSQSLLTQAILLVSLGIAPCPPTWRDAANNDVSITLDDLKNLAGLMAYNTQVAYSTSWSLKEQVDMATTPEEIGAITWPI
jgi:hypothetical protein